MKKSLIIISVGLLNLLHASFHVIQFVQSALLVAYSMEGHGHEHAHESTWTDTVLHSPYFAAVWAVIGIVTLAIGVKDYIHHRKCKHDQGRAIVAKTGLYLED